MNWTPLTPSRPGESLSSKLKSTTLTASSSYHPMRIPAPALGAWIGPLPESLHLLIIASLPVADLPRLARVSRGFGRLVATDEAWEKRWKSLGIQDIQRDEENATRHEDGKTTIASPSASHQLSLSTSSARAGFGDFSSSNKGPDDDFGEFVDVPIPPPSTNSSFATGNSLVNFDDVPLPSRFGSSAPSKGRTNGFFAFAPMSPPDFNSNHPGSHQPVAPPQLPKPQRPYRSLYRKHHEGLLPLISPLFTSPTPSPSQALSILFPIRSNQLSPPSPSVQSQTLASILRFLSPHVQPISAWPQARQLMLAVADRFDGSCLVGFEGADSRGDEAGMKAWAEAGWTVWWEANGGRRPVEDWEVGRVWIERKEIFYESSTIWDPLRNILYVPL